MLHLRDLDPREALPMAGAALVAALGLELDDAELGAALVGDHPGRNRPARQPLAVDHIGAVDKQKRRQRNRLAVADGQPLDEQFLTLLDAVLLAAGLDYRVGAHSDDAVLDADSALAPERRRPPLRPRRRGFDSRSSPASSPSIVPFDAGVPDAGRSRSDAVASVRPASSIRTRCFSPT